MCYDKTDKKTREAKQCCFRISKCSTCKKAKKWLDEQGISYEDRHIIEDNPTAEELKDWHERSGLPLKRFLTQAV